MSYHPRLESPAAIQAVIDEFVRLGRSAFLSRHGFRKSRHIMVRDPKTGQLCDARAIAAVAHGHQFPEQGALSAAQMVGSEELLVPIFQRLGFVVQRVGEDWSDAEVQATVGTYFDMLRLEAQQQHYVKTEFNAALRQQLQGRSKGSVELKFQNISAVLHGLDLPFISGYKPRSNAQLLLRQTVQQYLKDHAQDLALVVDAMEEVKAPGEKTFEAIVVDPPVLETVAQTHVQAHAQDKPRLPRKVDWASRDESNRALGRAGEQWAIGYEHKRLTESGYAELIHQLDWVSDRLGDGVGYDIYSHDCPGHPRYIEVKTTNGGHASSFVISKNELEASAEYQEAFYLYRVFGFRGVPKLYILQGSLAQQLHLEPMDYRASFRRLSN